MTLLDIARRVAQYLGRTDTAGQTILDLADQIKEEIRYVVQDLNRMPSHLTEIRGGTLLTVPGQTWYSTVTLDDAAGENESALANTIPVIDIVNIHYMRENPGASGLNEPLDEISYQDFERNYEGSVPQGQPEHFTRYSGQIGIWPSPSGGNNLYWSGIVKPASPVDDTQTSLWFIQYPELVTSATAARVCEKYLRNPEWAKEFRLTEALQRAALDAEYMQQASSGAVRPYG